MDKKQLILLVRKYLSGKASSEEQVFVEAWYQEAHSTMQIEDILTGAEIEQMEVLMFNRIQARIGHASGGAVSRSAAAVRTLRLYRKPMAVAASLLFLTLASFLAWQHFSTRGISYSTITTKPGQVRKLQLHDGTVAWLNADSRLRLPDDFGGSGSREVFLEGEAYFEVASDVKHPFLVHTQGLTTRVLGTRFNVKAYAEASNIEVTLLEGKVMLTAPSADPTVKKEDTLFLLPDQRAYFAGRGLHGGPFIKARGVDSLSASRSVAVGRVTTVSAGGLLKEVVDDAGGAAAWRDGQLVFHRESLEVVMAALSRKYAIQIHADTLLLPQLVSCDIHDQGPDEALLEVTRLLKRPARKAGGIADDRVQFRKEGRVYFIE